MSAPRNVRAAAKSRDDWETPEESKGRMNAYTVSIPVLVAAVMATIVAVTDPEPRTTENPASAPVADGGEQWAPSYTYSIPRFVADLEGDLSPVGDGSTNRTYDFPAWAPKPTPVPPAPVVATARPLPVLSTNIEAALAQCREHPDRFNWRPYALAAGFPEWALDELAYVVQNESGGDLCARNRSSGAICWVQQITGEPRYLDPMTCMAVGYSKWLDGGQDFWRHWYQWWN